MLWGQIFPWTLLGSAWSCLVVIRNDQKTFIYVFDNQGTGENNALDDNDEDSYDSWDDDDDKNCGCADDYDDYDGDDKMMMMIKIVGVQMIINWSRLLIAGSSRCIPNLFSISSFCNSSKPVRIVAQSFPISTPHERQVFIFFKLSEGKEIAKNSRWVSKQIGRTGFFKRSWGGK